MSYPDVSASPLRDTLLWLYVYPMLALATVYMGNDTPFQKLVTVPSYYTDILFALGFAYTIGLYACISVVQPSD